MSKPKTPKETTEQRESREAEEERIRVMQLRADSEEAAAGRSLLTRRTRAVARLFGSRPSAMSIGGGGITSPGGGTIGGGTGGGDFGGGGGLGLGFGLGGGGFFPGNSGRGATKVMIN